MHRMSYVWGGFYCSAYNVTQIKKRVKTLTYYKSGEGDDGEPEPMAEEEEEEEDEEEENEGGTGELPETQRDATTVEHDEELFRNNKLRLATPYSTDGEAEEIPEAWAKDIEENDGRNWTGISAASKPKKGLARSKNAKATDGDSDDDMFVDGEESTKAVAPGGMTTAAPAPVSNNMRRLAIRDEEDD